MSEKLFEENMRRFNTKNLNEQDMSYAEKVKKMQTRKKINKAQLLSILPVGKTATILQADQGGIVIVDENNNYYELI